MIAPRIAGLRCFQSPSRLVTEMKSAPKKTRDDFRRLEQGARQRRTCRPFARGKIGHRALAHDLAAGQELQGRRVGRGFGLDEHDRFLPFQ